MLSVSNLLCQHRAGNEALRYGHQAHGDRATPSGPPKPVVVWALTKACNQQCEHCYAGAKPRPAKDELTLDEGYAFLEDLKQFAVPAVLFSGGEPLVRPEFWDWLTYARGLGLRVTLSSNGTLITPDVAARLKEQGLTYAGLSLDGLEEAHDRLRRMPGAFQKTVGALKTCKAHGLRIGVRFTVHAGNQQDLVGLFGLCRDLGVDRLCIYHLAYAGRGNDMRAGDLTAQGTRAVVEEIFRLTREAHAAGHPLEVLTVGNHADAALLLMHLTREAPEAAQAVYQRLQGTGGNGSGSFIASVDPRGGVHYDQFSWHYTCGSIREQPFSEIWGQATDARLKLLRARQSHLPERCQRCQYLDLCNGNLRTRAEAATGDWLGMDPSCYLTDAEIRGC